jgi:hypothetical protein
VKFWLEHRGRIADWTRAIEEEMIAPKERVRYGRQRVAIGPDQANQVRRIAVGQRNLDQSVTWQQQKVWGTTLDQ